MRKRIEALLFGGRWRRDEHAWRVWLGIEPLVPTAFPEIGEHKLMAGRVTRIYQRAHRGAKAVCRFWSRRWHLAHARSGDRIAIAAYLGTSDIFDKAIAAFAETYANQNERDYKAMRTAVEAGRIEVAQAALLSRDVGDGGAKAPFAVNKLQCFLFLPQRHPADLVIDACRAGIISLTNWSSRVITGRLVANFHADQWSAKGEKGKGSLGIGT